jgi:hypothetical protein
LGKIIFYVFYPITNKHLKMFSSFTVEKRFRASHLTMVKINILIRENVFISNFTQSNV